jgi:hypothetical protein
VGGWHRLSCVVVSLGILVAPTVAAGRPADSCDLKALERSKGEFRRLSALRRFNASAVSDDDVRAASRKYVTRAEACYQALYGPPIRKIDDGALAFSPADGVSAEFTSYGTKWGAGSPFIGGLNIPGPGLPGGTVTYSFMGNGVDNSAEGSSANVAITSLAGYEPCFQTEIRDAFAAWSAVANIQFVEVVDNGAPFNAGGARGDIRIGSHAMDGPSGRLAHAYYPPPNGTTAAGDMHFDQQETWSCTPGAGIDIGIVTLHEAGHSIGLGHRTPTWEGGDVAVMNPAYNPSVASMLLADDIAGAVSIYGSAAPDMHSRRVVGDFDTAYGVWTFGLNLGWTQLHPLTTEGMIGGDMDGNGTEEIVIDFGPTYGVWVRVNDTTWTHLHTLSPRRMTAGDLDGNGRDDIILDFGSPYGIWVRYNNATWTQLHTWTGTTMVVGNVDGLAGDDIVISFPSLGTWIFKNNTSWTQLHGLVAVRMASGDFDGNGKDDVAMDFELGHGIWVNWNDNIAWSQAHVWSGVHLAAGNIDGNPRDELAIDFGPSWGIWVLRNWTSWFQLNVLPTQQLMLTDLDGNGRAEILGDFGNGIGLWIYVNDASWLQAHTISPRSMATYEP